MKYLLAGLAVAAAIAAAVFVRPPQIDQTEFRQQYDPRVSGVDAGAASPPARHTVTARGLVVYVAGEVRKPGLYTLPAGSRAADAVTRAGGALPAADMIAVNLAAPLNDGDEVAVPAAGSRSPGRRRAPLHRPAQRGHGDRRHRHRAAASAEPRAEPQRPIDVNAADAATLATVPGIGPALAERIVAFRRENGPFASVDELSDVSGITPRLQTALEAAVVVEPPAK